MAKSLRATRTKRNAAALRAKVFNPVDAARTARLHEKLMAIAAQPGPQEERRAGAMEVEMQEDRKTEGNAQERWPRDDDEMDVDADNSLQSQRSKKHKGKTTNRIQKKKRGKASSQVVFPDLKKRAQKMKDKARARKR